MFQKSHANIVSDALVLALLQFVFVEAVFIFKSFHIVASIAKADKRLTVHLLRGCLKNLIEMTNPLN